MAKTFRRLGRGLDALVSQSMERDPEPNEVVVNSVVAEISNRTEITIAADGKGVRVAEVELERVVPNAGQPRRTVNAEGVAALAESIRRSGVLQPVLVRPVGDKFQLIAGERRWRAAKLAGLARIPVIVRDASEEETFELALVENLQREDLTPIDRAMAYQQFGRRFGLTADQIAKRVGEDRSTVVNYMRLLELTPGIQQLVSEGKLTMGHARSLLGVADEDRRDELAGAILKEEFSVRFLEELIRREKKEGPKSSNGPSRERNAPAPHVREVERRFEEALKTKVKIREGKRKGSGRIVIEYYSLNDFDRIAGMMNVKFE